MKNVNKLFLLAVTCLTVIGAVGCGGSEETQTNANGVGVGAPPPAYNPGVVNPGNGSTMPVGCYPTSYSQCSPCPDGYTQNGNSCYFANNGYNNGGTYGNYGCYAGYFWNGYACQPAGVVYQCPYGSTWSNYYYACIGYSYPNYYQSNCKVKRSGIFYFTYCY